MKVGRSFQTSAASLRRQPQAAIQAGGREDIFESAESPQKEWTFLFYNATQGALSTMATESVNDLERVGSDENTNVVVLNHRERGTHERLLGRFAEYEGTRTYYVTKEDKPSTRSLLGDSLGSLADLALSGPNKVKSEVISSSPEKESLKTFLLQNMKRFPARRYALVMTGHGAAFQGQLITRDEEGRQALSNDEIGKVLREVAAENGQGVDLVNLNTCFSANLETLFSLKDSTHAIVASQSELTLRTQPFGAVLSEAQKRLKGRDLGAEELAGLFVEKASEQPLSELYTPSLSAFQAAEIGNLGKAVEELQKSCMEQGVAPALIRECLSDAVSVDFAQSPRQVELADLGSVAAVMAEKISDPSVKRAAGKVQESLKRSVLAEQHSTPEGESLLSRAVRKLPYLVGPQKSLEGSTGLTVFWDPAEKERHAFIEESDFGREHPIHSFMDYLAG